MPCELRADAAGRSRPRILALSPVSIRRSSRRRSSRRWRRQRSRAERHRRRHPRLRDSSRRSERESRTACGAGGGLAGHCSGDDTYRACGSGLQALHYAVMGIASGAQNVVVAGGVESMSRVPMGSDRRVAGGPPIAAVSATAATSACASGCDRYHRASAPT